MKEQHGVPLFVRDTIRFDRPGTATAEQQGQYPSNRYRTPPGSIHRAGHSLNHHPEDVPYTTDDATPQAARQQRQRPHPQVFADADYGDEPTARSYTTARRLDRNPLETRKLPDRRFDAGRLLRALTEIT